MARAKELKGWRRIFRGDGQIWLIILILAVISLIEVFSASATIAYKEKSGDTFYYFSKHLITLLMGGFMIYAFQMFDVRNYMHFAFLLLLGSLALLVITHVSGVARNDATRWIDIHGYSVQASDVAKIPLVIFLAKQLALHQDKIQDFLYGVLPLVFWIILTCGLILPHNLSTAVLVGVVGFALLAVGNVRMRHLIPLGLGLAVVAVGGVMLLRPERASTWEKRLEVFAQDDGVRTTQQDRDAHYQADLARIAIANGIFIGRGPGNSTQQVVLPNPHNDFIFANMIEEGGIAMGAVVIALYIWLLARIHAIIRRSKNPYHDYLCTGLGLMIVIQGFIHMLVNVGLLPVTGQQLPLISMGGTSILITSISLGMVLSVARQQRKEFYEGEAIHG